MKLAKKFHKAYTTYLAGFLIIVPQAIEFFMAVEPLLGSHGTDIISVLGAVLLVLRALPQPELHTDD